MELRQVSETATTVTLGWDPVAGAAGFRFTVDGKISHTWDATRVTVRVSKNADRVLVEALGVSDTGVWPDTTPPPPPPPAGALRYKPPGWDGSGDVRDPRSFPGYVVIDGVPIVSGKPQDLNLDNSKDYYVKLGKVEWSSGPFPTGSDMRTALSIRGGRNVVIVGGELLFHSTNTTDDCGGIRVHGGDPTGKVYIEGVRVTSVNGITWSSPRDLILQHSHIRARTFQDRHDPPAGDGNHPDAVQVWLTAEPAEFFFDRVTAYTWFTGLVCLLSQPVRWQRHRTDLHFGTRLGATQQMGNYMLYLSPGNQTVTCAYDGGDSNWMDLGYWGGIREQLQMAIDSPGWSTKLGYEILRPSTGEKWASSNPNAFRGPLVSVGATQGDQWRCTSNPNITEKWNWGVPAGGEFAPWDRCGVGYEPVGYQT